MSIETLFATTERYEARFDLSDEERFNIHEDFDHAIQNFLIIWAASVPQAALKLYRDSLNRAIQFITKRRFILRGVFLRGREISVTYLKDGQTAYQITILPQKVLLLDVEKGSKEAAYPIDWTPDSFGWLTCQTREEKLDCYRKFLDSKKYRWLAVVGATENEREELLNESGDRSFDLVILEEGKLSRTLKNTLPYNDDSLVKSILYRNSKDDSFVRAHQFTSRDYCMCIQFLPDESS